MTICHCRVCGRPFPETPLLCLENMPKSAQFLPNAVTLSQDHGVNLDVHQCAGCGLVQISNDPVPYYREVIRAAGFSEDMRTFRRRQFSAFVGKYGLKGKKLVEIGCGSGEYLELFQETGVDAYGLEYAEASVEHCRKRGLRVVQGFINGVDDAPELGVFDAFATLNFLEHWPDPNATLSGIAHKMRPGGVGLVEVPNFDMILRKNLFGEFISDHITYFTRETLETVLRLNGFEVLENHEVWHDYMISAVVRKRGPCDVTPFAHSRHALKTEIDHYIREYGSKGLAIWGAGHQSLATITLLGLASDIRYVVDSAPFKQNTFTPASHIPIVAPSRLLSDPVGAIIVMAASYSDEVARIIRQQFGAGISTAILRDYGLERLT